MRLGWAAAGGLLAAFACRAPAWAQSVEALSLDLVGANASQSAHLVPIAGTIIVSRNDTAAGGAAEPANKLDLVFGPSIWTNKAALLWLAGGGAQISAVFTVTLGRQTPVSYTLTGISLRSLSVTAQGGEGQASFIVGASHVRVGGVSIN